MAEYIEREAAIAKIERLRDKCGNDEMAFALNWAIGLLEKIPAADVRPVRHERWIEQPLDFDLCGVAYYQCSECGKEQQTPSNYCQFCGALMDKDGDGE